MTSRYFYTQDDLNRLRRRAAQALKEFREHFDGCKGCTEFAWENELCIEGYKLMKRSRELHEEIEAWGEV